MTSASDAMPQSDAGPRASAQAAGSATRPLYWSVRRELWENPAIWRAPLIAAAVVLVGMLIATFHPPRIHTSGFEIHQSNLHALPYFIAAAAIGVLGAFVAVLYCLGALHNERRDRSILFWKSLPVSDLTTVAAKVLVPLVVLPVCVLATVIATHLVMLGLNIGSMMARGESPAALLADVTPLKLWLMTAWTILTFVLWWVPIYGWLFVISVWAKRMTFVWAVAPPIGLIVFERLAFGTQYVGDLINYRLKGSFAAAFTPDKGHMGASLDPLGFVSTPGLWAGLAVGAALIALAIRLRRRADPI
jgi:ABC-2 type transport system permease protein